MSIPRSLKVTAFLVALLTRASLLVADTTAAEDSVNEFTAKITAELAIKSPEAARLFTEANAARDQEAFALAEALYRHVLKLEPDFHHAKRRLSSVVLPQGRREEALALSQEVLLIEPSPENRAMRVSALVSAEEPSKAEIEEAVTLANELLALDAPDSTLILPACQAAIASDDWRLLQTCVRRLEQVAPEEESTYYFGWLAAISAGDLDLATAKLELAREAGMGLAAYEELMAVTEDARPLLPKLLRWGRTAGIIWAGGLVVLLMAGLVLSRVTLRAARQLAGARGGRPVGLSDSLRNLYHGVLRATCGYYFLSLPIIVLAVIGLGAGAILWILTFEVIPLKLVLLILGVVVVTVIAVLSSVLIRPQRIDPGSLLDPDTQPRLREVLNEVAQQIDTRPVDNVYLTPTTDLAVMERGGVFRQMQGRAERCLILGVGVLDGMKIGPFKAILAHEYGHFSNRDTAGGGFALAVTRSIHLTAMGLAEGGAAAWYNPAWLFLVAFNWIFLIVSQGASRLQEILADRWAALAYGAEQFERGLRHTIEQSVRFFARAGAILDEMYEAEVPNVTPNFYVRVRQRAVPETEIQQAIESAVSAKTSLVDSHPSPAQRFDFVRRQASAPTGDLSDSEKDVWSLFENREEIERSMSRLIWQSNGMLSDGDLEVAFA